jgi:hypothetical protein
MYHSGRGAGSGIFSTVIIAGDRDVKSVKNFTAKTYDLA